MNLDSVVVNPWVGFIGTIFGVLGLLVSVIIYFRSRRFQRPAYYRSSIKWFDGKTMPHEDIKLMFRSKEISRFTITHLAFWNAGNQTIRKSDFVPASPLRLSVPENAEVFDVRVTASTAPEICASVGVPHSFVAGTFKDIPINFDYLDADDGFSIQVIHDGTDDDGFQFIGKLPGVSKFQSGSSFSEETNLLSPYSHRSRGIPYTSPLMKWIIMPSVGLGLGGIGIWSLYWAIFKEFHWYQILGGLMVVYLFLPFFFLSEVSAPKALHMALTNTVKPAA